jgi:serine/threonine-protein kinase
MSSDVNRREGTLTETKKGTARRSVETDFTLPFPLGEVLLGKYRVEELIGTGGIGFVVSATNIGLDEQVALKFLRPEFLENDEAVHRFTNEARLAAKVQHPNVARVLDIGSADGLGPFIVMELLVGRDLNQILREEGPLPVERAVDYVLEACAALSAAHARDIVHRDVKPDNLFLARQQQGRDIIKILDFGISKQTSRHARNPALFQTITALGSPSYMSPEQIRASPEIDGRADVWSLGCVLYELLTGRHAFDAPTLMQVCAVVLEREPQTLSAHVSGVPTGLEAVIHRCLEKSPDARYANVDELAHALRPFSSQRLERREEPSADETPRFPAPPRLPATPIIALDEPDAASPLSTAPMALETQHGPAPHKTTPTSPRLKDALMYAAVAACVGITSATLIAPHREPARSVAARAQSPATEQAARAPLAPPPAPVSVESLPLAENTGKPRAARSERETTRDARPASAPLQDTTAEPSAASVAITPAPTPELPASLTAPSAPSEEPASSAQVTAEPSEPARPREQPSAPTTLLPRAEPVMRPSERAESASKPDPVHKLSSRAVSSVVRAHASAIQNCFERAQVDYDSVKGRVAIVATLDRDGNVLDARASLPHADEARLALCLTTAAKHWKFPAERSAAPLTQYRLVLE